MVAVEQLLPRPVAERGRTVGRADDVREQDGRKHPIRRGLLPAARVPHTTQELVCLIEQTFGKANVTRRLDELRPGDSFRHIPGATNRKRRILGGMDDQRRHSDGREDMPSVDLAVYRRQRLDRAGAGGRSPEVRDVSIAVLEVDPGQRLGGVAARP